MQRIFFTIILSLGTVQYVSVAGADPHPPVDIAELERQIHQQINRERQNHGLAALASDEQLAAIARNHSRDMASHRFFNHINLQGEKPSERGKRQGWNKQKQIGPETLALGVAENICLTHLYDNVFTIKQNGKTVKREYDWKNRDQIAQTIVQGWLNSPHHRKVMLSPQYERQGIGLAISGYDVYVTENLF